MPRLQQELEGVAEGRYSIVIGTQLLAKGHHFPDVTLAGVIDADVGLANGDPRAAERTFQLLQQVTGRAGRGKGEGRGILQSYQPEHPVLQALLSGDSERFYTQEIAMRQEAGPSSFRAPCRHHRDGEDARGSGAPCAQRRGGLASTSRRRTGLSPKF